MAEVICPNCKQHLQTTGYGEYVECSGCGVEFFNIDPSVIQPKTKGALHLVRMITMVIFLLLATASLVAAFCGNAVFYGASAFPLLCAVACIWENGFRLLTGIFLGIIIGSVAAFGIGALYMTKAEDALMVVPLGAVLGLVLGFGINEILRATSKFGERCPFCNSRGIRGCRDAVSCKNCGHKPHIRPESRMIVELLKDRNCNSAKIFCRVVCILGLVLIILPPFLGPTTVVFGIIFIVIAAWGRRYNKCKHCGTPWTMIKIGEKESGRSGVYGHYTNVGDARDGFQEGWHHYQNVTTVTTRACRCCGHLTADKHTSREKLD